MFFSPRNKETALGMYSPLYFITLAFFILLITIALFFSRKMKEDKIKMTIKCSGVFMWITEFVKMIFVGITYGVDEVEFIPLYFCSMSMYACCLYFFKSKHLENTALSFLFFGGIIGAIAFFAHPSAVIPNYHLFHYMTIRTFIYHSLMIYLGLLIVITGFYKPKFNHFKYYAIFLGITFLGAYILNIVNDSNLMYISEPLEGIKLSTIVYEAIPEIYPFLFIILELVFPFFISYGMYKLIIKLFMKGRENYVES